MNRSVGRSDHRLVGRSMDSSFGRSVGPSFVRPRGSPDRSIHKRRSNRFLDPHRVNGAVCFNYLRRIDLVEMTYRVHLDDGRGSTSTHDGRQFLVYFYLSARFSQVQWSVSSRRRHGPGRLEIFASLTTLIVFKGYVALL